MPYIGSDLLCGRGDLGRRLFGHIAAHTVEEVADVVADAFEIVDKVQPHRARVGGALPLGQAFDVGRFELVLAVVDRLRTRA